MPRNVAGWKTETDPGWGVSHPDQLGKSTPGPRGWEDAAHFLPGCGRDRPVSHPTLRSGGGGGGGLWSGEVRVSTVSVDVDRKRVNQTVSTVPDGMDVNVSQWDSLTQLNSGLPPRGGGGCGRCG